MLKEQRPSRLAKRTVQIIGFGMASILLTIRIVASIRGLDSGISEYFIAGLIGVGVSAEIDFLPKSNKGGDK